MDVRKKDYMTVLYTVFFAVMYFKMFVKILPFSEGAYFKWAFKLQKIKTLNIVVLKNISICIHDFNLVLFFSSLTPKLLTFPTAHTILI